MSRYVFLCFGVLLSVTGVAQSADAQEPTLSYGVVAVNGKQLDNAPLRTISASPGDRIQVDVFIRDWSADKQPLAGYQVEVDPLSFSSGANGVIEPIGLQNSVETNTPDIISSYVDRKHPRYIYKGIQNLDVTKSFGKGYRIASVVVGDEGPISNQDGVTYYAGTMDMVVSDNAAGRFELIPSDEPRKSVLMDHATVAILPLHCESVVIDVCSDVDASTITLFIDDLLSPDRNSDLQLPCPAVEVSDHVRVNLGLDALDATRFSLDNPNAPDEDLPTTNDNSEDSKDSKDSKA